MELGEWVWGRIIENLDNRGSDKRGYTVSLIVQSSMFTVEHLSAITEKKSY